MALVPLVQHAIGLLAVVELMVFGAGCGAAADCGSCRTFLAAVWPRMLWYEHEFIATFLAAFVAVIALLLTPEIVQSRWIDRLMFAFVCWQE